MIIIPKNEIREMRLIKLDNGIKVFIIEDESIKNIKFMLKISSGSLNDTVDGLAHFLEHMIFMGSNKYPDENYFMKMLNKFNGKTNAYTGLDKTVYYFEFLEEYFEDIIDIFYNLIKSPLISKDSLEREMRAVDMEHNKNKLNESWRLYQLKKNLSDSNHKLNSFSTGNLETLKREDIRERLIEYFNKHYHSGNMSIALSSSGKSKKKIRYLNKTFGSLEKRESIKELIGYPFNDNLGKKYFLKSVGNSKRIKISWVIKDRESFTLLLILLLDMNFNSLKKILIEGNYISNMDLQLNALNIIDLNIIVIDRDNIENILNIVYSYLRSLLKIEEENMCRYINDMSKITKNEFNYGSPINTNRLLDNIIEDINEIEDERLLINNYVYKKEGYKDMIINLILQRGVVIVSYNDRKSNLLKERYYGLEYKYIGELEVEKKSIEIILPEIENIPNNLKLYKNDEKLVVNENIINRFNYSWRTPQVYLRVFLNNESFSNSKENVYDSIYICKLLNKYVSIKLSNILITGYNIILKYIESLNSISIEIIGYNKNIDILIEEFFKLIKKEPEEYIKKIVNEDMRKSGEMLKYDKPFNSINMYINMEILGSEKRLDVYNMKRDIDYNNIIERLLKSNSKIYQYGNYDRLYNEYIERYINKKGVFKIGKVNLELNDKIFSNLNKEESDKSIHIYFNMGENNLRNNVITNIIESILGNEYFDEIRTRRQLGYLTSLISMDYNNELFIVERLQNNIEIEKSLESLKEFNKNIVNIVNEKRFMIEKKNYIKSLEEGDNRFIERYNKDSYEIISNRLEFDRERKLIEECKSVEYKDILGVLKVFSKGIIYIIK